MTDIEERFAGNGDNGSLIERQLFRRASVKRESRTRPTKNRCANLTLGNVIRAPFTENNPGSAHRYCNYQAYGRR
jgi:hypothetical protein